MAKRKTVTVEYLRNLINKRIADSTCSPEGRLAMRSILETILMDTDNYRGFRYLDGYPCADESRVEYH